MVRVKNDPVKSSEKSPMKPTKTAKNGFGDGSFVTFKQFASKLFSDLALTSTPRKNPKPKEKKPENSASNFKKTNSLAKNSGNNLKLHGNVTPSKPSIAKARFYRIIKDVAFDITKKKSRWDREAVRELQLASEEMLVQLFVKVNNTALQRKRITIKLEDMQSVLSQNEAFQFA